MSVSTDALDRLNSQTNPPSSILELLKGKLNPSQVKAMMAARERFINDPIHSKPILQPNTANYFDNKKFTYNGQEVYAEDHRQGWSKEGDLIGLPVIRASVSKETPGLFHIVRPYYLINSQNQNIQNENGDPVITFNS